ncbi:MAG: glycerol kinase [Planctomycetes bacterium]|nr:glycerol kinase [Planctomycetota bacterium]
MEKFILAIDQGSTATKAGLVDKNGRIVARGSAQLAENHPAPGWVDQNPMEIWLSIGKAAKDCLAGRPPECIEAVGLANQRESVLLWDKKTGMPISALISWQDHRTADESDRMRELGLAQMVRDRSGLPLDPMFSALKAKWLLDIYDPDRSRANVGEIRIGTVDSFILSRFARDDHTVEIGNASRTQLMNIRSGEWDAELCETFQIPMAALPKIVKSTGPFPAVVGVNGIPDGTPVLAVMGNSHASLFGHGAFRPGILKATLATGTSVMGLVEDGDTVHPGLCLTIGWDMGERVMAAEANIRSTGAAIRWVANLFGIAPWEVGNQAEQLFRAGKEGAVVIPGFNGLGAPWWDNNATGLVWDLTLDSRMDSLALGAVESIPHQIIDVLEVMRESGTKAEALFADGSAAVSPFIMQMHADLAGLPVSTAQELELAMLGVGHMAGLAAGWWNQEFLEKLERPRHIYHPVMPPEDRQRRRDRWRKGLARARSQDGYRAGW